ncbi:MAG TPA: signal recognition particle protein, partial [Candidatus Mcinerneyibacterium sp.]|nr:signal recognition particle protein [Candidatus Mcinerneyibacterium sp.]
QIKMIKKMGPLNKIMKMIPGMPKDLDIDDKEIVKVESIIQSMTPKERLKPKIIKASRKRRIAKGCGRSVADINRLLRRYKKSKKMLKQIGGKFGKKGMNIPNMFK